MRELKPLSRDAVDAALAKAERYRFLNEPGEAESICLDILAVDPANQGALITLLLALTDQFGEIANAHQADHPESESAVIRGRQQRYMPQDRCRLHEVAGERDQQSEPQEAEVAVLQGGKHDVDLLWPHRRRRTFAAPPMRI